MSFLLLYIAPTIALLAAVIAVKSRVKGNGSLQIDSLEATTAHVPVLYPFQASGGPDVPGVYIGDVVTGGEPFTYDPWELYDKLPGFTNPNFVVAGQIGRGKSSLVKTLVWRNAAFGRTAVILDPKGEYERLVEAMGGTIVRLVPGGDVTVNPLDTDNPDIATEILHGITAAALGRDLSPDERAAIVVAQRTVATTKTGRVATIPDVVEAMFNPDEEQAAAVHTSTTGLAAASRDAALAMWELCQGPLKGMFDGETNIHVNWEAPLVVVDVSALGQDNKALSVVMAAALSWIHPVVAQVGSGQRTFILDEAWHLLSDVALARWVQSMFKLSRNYGLSNGIVIHRFSDLAAAGEEAAAIARGLLSDAETKIVYAQAPTEVADAQAVLGLTDTERELLTQLPLGVAIWKIRDQSYPVRHVLGPDEQWIVDTNQSMRIREQVPA